MIGKWSTKNDMVSVSLGDFLHLVLYCGSNSGGSGLEDICLVLVAVVWNLEDISINVQNHCVPLVRFGAHLFQWFSGHS